MIYRRAIPREPKLEPIAFHRGLQQNWKSSHLGRVPLRRALAHIKADASRFEESNFAYLQRA